MLSKLQAPMASAAPRRPAGRRVATQQRAGSLKEAAPQEGTPPSPMAAAPHPQEDFRRHGRGPGSTHSEPIGGRGKSTGKGQVHAQPIPGQGWFTDGRQWWPADPAMMMASWSSTPYSSWSFPSQQTQVNPMESEKSGKSQYGTGTKTQTKTKTEPEAEKPSKKDKGKDKEKKEDKGRKGKKPKEEPPEEDPPDWGDGDDGEDPDGSDYTYEEESEEEELQEPDQEVEVTPRSTVNLTPRTPRSAEGGGAGPRPEQARQRPGPKRRAAAHRVHQAAADPPNRRRRGGAPPDGSGPPSTAGSGAPSSRRSSTMNTDSVRDLLHQRDNALMEGPGQTWAK